MIIVLLHVIPALPKIPAAFPPRTLQPTLWMIQLYSLKRHIKVLARIDVPYLRIVRQ